MNTYEGMFIFTDQVKAEEVESAITAVRAEIEKLGGTVESTTRLGRRTFARPLKKQEAGQYAVLVFTFDGGKLDALQARYKLVDVVLRVQFIRTEAPVPVAAAEEKADG